MALGMFDRGARPEIVRPAAADALLPGLDQTRMAGLVTLPGAFGAMLPGGASPVEAGAVRLFVLMASMAVRVVAVAVVLELVVRAVPVQGVPVQGVAAPGVSPPAGVPGPEGLRPR